MSAASLIIMKWNFDIFNQSSFSLGKNPISAPSFFTILKTLWLSVSWSNEIFLPSLVKWEFPCFLKSFWLVLSRVVKHPEVSLVLEKDHSAPHHCQFVGGFAWDPCCLTQGLPQQLVYTWTAFSTWTVFQFSFLCDYHPLNYLSLLSMWRTTCLIFWKFSNFW